MDEAGNTRSTWSDALGRLTQVSEGSEGYITDYNYDALNNLLCIEQHGGVTSTGCSSPSSDDATSLWRVRRFTYDSLSRLLTAKNPETGTITYGYNLDSVLTSKTDARGKVVTYTPDTVHRVTQAAYSDSTPAKTYTYDVYTAGSNYGIGRRTSMTDGSGTTAWTYDTMGRILTEKQTINSLIKTTTDTYNFDGSVATTTYPSGAVLSVTPGGAGRPLAETDTTNTINYAQSMIYAPTGQLASAVYGEASGGYAGIVQINSYNSRGQPIRLQDCGLSSCTGGNSSTPYLLDLSYSYGLGVNDNGNVLGITINNATNSYGSQSFTYDDLNRLTSASASGLLRAPGPWGINFAGGIDAWGNLTQTSIGSNVSVNPMPINQQVNGKNQFTLLGYTYDAAGNVLADGSGNTSCAGATYTWDAEEQITCALGSTYSYDGDGVRVMKSSGDATPTIYWGAGTLAESDTSGNLTSEYIFLGGRRIARRDVATGNVYYYFSDALGSSNVVATAAGALENSSSFYPYGGELTPTQNLTNQKYKFEGKERDPESASLAQPQGLDNFGARFDSSAMGRFMSPDWANSPEPVPYAKMGNPQTLNLYAFAGNNPESAPDLDGHQGQIQCSGVIECGDGSGGGDAYAGAAGQAQLAFINGGNPAQAAQNLVDDRIKNGEYSGFNSLYRLVIDSDSICSTGMRCVTWELEQLSSNGQTFSLNEWGATDPHANITEHQTEECGGCTQFGIDWRSGGGVDQNGNLLPKEEQGTDRFEDRLAANGGQMKSKQSFTMSKELGLNPAKSEGVMVRIAGKDYRSLGLWSDGKQIPWVQGYPSTVHIPAGNPPVPAY